MEADQLVLSSVSEIILLNSQDGWDIPQSKPEVSFSVWPPTKMLIPPQFIRIEQFFPDVLYYQGTNCLVTCKDKVVYLLLMH